MAAPQSELEVLDVAADDDVVIPHVAEPVAPGVGSYPDASTIAREVRTGRRRADLLFLGDALTERWLHPFGGRAAFIEEFGRWHPVAFGVSGDEAAHLRARLAQGALDGMSPRVTVLAIGAHQIDARRDALETANAIERAAIDVLERLPSTQLLLCSVLPQDRGSNRSVLAKIRVVNNALRGHQLPRTTFVDATTSFADARGIHGALFRDGFHLSRDGYRAWAAVLRQYIIPFLREAPRTERWRIQGGGALRSRLRELTMRTLARTAPRR